MQDVTSCLQNYLDGGASTPLKGKRSLCRSKISFGFALFRFYFISSYIRFGCSAVYNYITLWCSIYSVFVC